MASLTLAVLALVLGAQQAPGITVGIRPQAVRVGDVAVVTLRVSSGRGFPEVVDLPPLEGLVLEDYRDRTSAGIGTGSGRAWVFERNLTFLAESPGEYQLSPVRVVLQGDTFLVEGPSLSVSPVPLQWSSAYGGRPSRTPEGDDRRAEAPVLPGGTPPPPGEMGEGLKGIYGPYGPWWGNPLYSSAFSQGVQGYWGAGYPAFGGMPGAPWGGYPTPYGPNGGWLLTPPGGAPNGGFPVTPPFSGPGGYPQTGVSWPGWGWPGIPWPGMTGGLPPPPGGRWPQEMGGGWAETADGDPWWPEIVPELHGYVHRTQDPSGGWSLATGVTPHHVYVGQQATFVATAAFEPGAFLGLGRDPEYLPPESPDFWSLDLPDPIEALATASLGRSEQGYTFRRALFPMRPGELVVPSARVLVPRTAGGMTVVSLDTLVAEHMTLTVLPVPRAPDLPGYAGAVGRYRLEADVIPRRLAVGETALLVVRVLGVGNVRALPPPEVGLVYGAEIAPGGDGAAVEVRDGVVGGVRTFTWMVVPTEPGPLRIGPVLFTFFDPYVGDFGQVASEELVVEVTEFPGGG